MYTSLSLGRAPGPDILRPRQTLAGAAIRTLHAVGGRIRPILHRWRTNARARHARAALLTMSDHLLRDIGVSRLEILGPSAREQSAWGNRW
jgi:uncharacterized protein YjiS (DUF1127 family)